MLTLALLLTSALTPQDNSPCARAIATMPGKSCVATEHGVAVADTPEEAERLASYARTGEARFKANFGSDVPSYAVVASPPTPNRSTIRAAGFEHVLAWPSGAAFERATREGVERAARGFAASQGMTAEQADQVVATAIANQPDARFRAAMDASMVPHELGHLWYTSTFWPEDRGYVEGSRPHYGGPGPDWLDEAAGIVMEEQTTADQRRNDFRSLMRGETVASLGRVDGRPILLDVIRLVSRQHPGLEAGMQPSPQAAASARANGGVGVSYTPAGAGPAARPGAMVNVFYIQTRVFTDYLIQKSGRSDIIAVITRAVAAGGTFEAWLARDGAALGLPATLADLQSDWQRYAEQV